MGVIPTRMMPMGVWRKQSGPQIPYVTDGLVAWWDGLWNAGLGVHDDAATVWRNLVGGDILGLDVTGKATFGADHTSFVPAASVVTNHPVPSQAWHQEMVFDWAGLSNSDRFNPTLGANRVYVERNYSENTPKQTSITTSDGNYEASGINVDTVRRATLSMTVPVDAVGSKVVFYKNGVRYTLRPSYSGTRPIIRQVRFGANAAGSFKVYSFRLYNRTLTAAEVAANYAVDKERFNLP